MIKSESRIYRHHDTSIVVIIIVIVTVVIVIIFIFVVREVLLSTDSLPVIKICVIFFFVLFG
jgi:hypothetical protein